MRDKSLESQTACKACVTGLAKRMKICKVAPDLCYDAKVAAAPSLYGKLNPHRMQMKFITDITQAMYGDFTPYMALFSSSYRISIPAS